MAVLPDLSRRNRVCELMDDPALAPGQHDAALRGLARLNTASGSSRLLWPSLLEATRQAGARRIRVLDLATGSGDVPMALMRRAPQAGVSLQVDGCDVSERAIGAARARASRAGMGNDDSVQPRFFVQDVLADELPAGYDIIMCSLFMHHLEDEQATHLLYKMRCAANHILVSDLERRRDGLVLAWSASRLMTRSPVVRTDAVRSVRAAFTIDEFTEVAETAGITNAKVSRCWPCRFIMEWKKL